MLAELDRLFRNALLNFFRRQGMATSAAEDLTQDVFVRIVSYQKLHEIRNIRSFLFRTAVNLLRDNAKSRRRWKISSLEESGSAKGLEAELIDTITPERILQGCEDFRVVSEAFEELDARTQRIFILNRIDRMRHRDIANHLGLSVSLVEKSLRSAHAHLTLSHDRQRFSNKRQSSAAMARSLLLNGLAFPITGAIGRAA
jgi:RNA polymerase sigma factor (sigma-70 family)